MLPFIIIGLTAGAVYALAGLGLVLTYKTSGVFNFAHGALATIGAYVFYVLFVLHDWAWPLAAAVAVLVAGPIMGLILERLARRIQTASLALQVAATVGLLLLIESGVRLVYGTDVVRTVPIFLGTDTFELGGTNVQVAQLVTFLFAIVVTALLTAFFKISRRGIAMRAVVDNPDLLDIAGTSPGVTRRLAWIVGVCLASASGVLFAPLLVLDPVQLTLLVVAAYGAAAVGAFTSLPLTLAGGLGIGVLEALSTKWFTSGVFAGLPPSLPFIVLFLVILVFPKKYLVGRSFMVPRTRPRWQAPVALQLVLGGVLIVVLVAVPNMVVGIHLTDWTTFVAMTIVFMSLSLLVRTSAQVSLCQVTFMAIGACAFSQLTVDMNLPWALALILAGLIAVPIGALLAVPAIRLTGLYLALATFGFGILVQRMFYSQEFMFGADGIGLTMPRPSGFTSDTNYYYLVVALAAAAAVAMVALTRSRLGRLLRGAADSTVALETAGTAVKVTRVMVFCLSAFMAAVGGALAGVGQSTIGAASYEPIVSLVFFVVIILVVGGAPWDAVLASAALLLIPSYVSDPDVNTWLQLLLGAGAIAFACLPASMRGVPQPLAHSIDRMFGRTRVPPRKARTVSAPPPSSPSVPGGMKAENLEVRFGGLVAVDRVTLHAPDGRITGLIGPNGAGKTTTFNACSGLVRPAGGSVSIGGHDVSRRGPSARARKGLGRTFQKMELFDSLTVRENVEAGAEGPLAGLNPFAHVLGRPGQRAAIRDAAQSALELCELADVEDTPASALSTGQRRLVELARCLAGPFGLLLLDEPSSGLDPAETERFGQILTRVVAERGVGILLVEHDMSLVLDICQHIYVLDFGELVFEGSPSEIRESPVVRAAYLGDTEIEAVLP